MTPLDIRERVVLLLGVLTLAFILAVAYLNDLVGDRARRLLHATQQERERNFDQLVELKGSSVATFAKDYTFWDDMVRFVQTGDGQWATENIDVGLSTYVLDAVWVYTVGGTYVYSVNMPEDPRLKDLPVPREALASLFGSKRFVHFFAATPRGFIEIRGATIHPSADSKRLTPPRGYLFAGRLWNAQYVGDLAELTGSSIGILPVSAGQAGPPRVTTTAVTFARGLPGWDGALVARVEVRSEAPAVEGLTHTADQLRLLAVGFAVSVLVLLSLVLWRWVTAPLTLLSASLSADSPGPIAGMLGDRTEFGRLAALIHRFFEQKATLETEVSERASVEAEVRRLNVELEQRVLDRTTRLADREQKLSEAKRFLEHLIASTPGVMFRRRADEHTITYVSPTIRTVMGYAPDEVVGVRDWWPGVIHPDDRARVLDQLRDGLRGRAPSVAYEYRYRHRDGDYRWFHTELRPEYDEAGIPVEILGYALDVTDRMQAQRRLAAQDAVTRILAEASTLAEATPGILRAVCETLEWQLGGLWAVDPSANVLRLVEVWRASPGDVSAFVDLSRRTAFPPGVGLPGRVWASGMPAWIPDVVEDDNFPRAPIAAQVGLHGAFGFPIRIGSDLFGALEFFSHEIRQPDDELLAMMSAIGSQIGQFIERRRAEQAVRDSEARKTAILETALDCIITMDHQGRVIEFNPAAERTFGYDRAEAMGREVADLIIPPALREAHRKGLAGYLATGEGPVLGRRLELPAIRADGTEFPVELAISRIPTDGPPIFTAYVRDITSRKRDEEALRRSKEEADRANKAKSEFLSRMSHELRTPLNAILGFGQLLEMDPLEVAQQESVAHILRAGRHLLELIDEVLDISRIEAGRLRLTLAAVPLREVVQECLDLILPAAQEAGVEVSAVEGSAEWVVLADRQRLKQVILNLLSNGVKYNREGGTVTVSLEQSSRSHLRVHVADTGVAIAPERLERLFTPFERLGVEKAGIEGIGLGLIVSKSLVEAMGGTIGVESVPGVGTAFWFELPIVPQAVAKEADARTTASS